MVQGVSKKNAVVGGFVTSTRLLSESGSKGGLVMASLSIGVRHAVMMYSALWSERSFSCGAQLDEEANGYRFVGE